MKGILSIIRKFILRVICLLLLTIFANLVIIGLYLFRFQKSVSQQTAVLPLLKQFTNGLQHINGFYRLDAMIEQELDKQQLWAILIDDKKGNALWQYKVPKNIPAQYTYSDIAALSRYYLHDYPVVTWKHPNGLLIIGYPKTSLWKVAYMFPYDEIKSMPQRAGILFLINLLLVFVFYFHVNSKSLRGISYILEGIKSLASGKSVHLNEKCNLGEIARQLNQTSDLLNRRKTAQENWIAGISHDVRTPLTVILGYADSIAFNTALPEEIQDKAALIKHQSIQLRNLVSDLNLITRLGNSSQPVNLQRFIASALCREIVASFLNDELPQNFSIDITIQQGAEGVSLLGDRELLRRAIHNLIYNCMKHNPSGCVINVSLVSDKRYISFIISDNGKGMAPDAIALLEERSHYLEGDDLHRSEQHGFGIYIVQQICKMHQGNVAFSNNEQGGFMAMIKLPQ